jgi:hypothetical protein
MKTHLASDIRYRPRDSDHCGAANVFPDRRAADPNRSGGPVSPLAVPFGWSARALSVSVELNPRASPSVFLKRKIRDWMAPMERFIF